MNYLTYEDKGVRKDFRWKDNQQKPILVDTDVGIIKPGFNKIYYNFIPWSIRRYASNKSKSRKAQERNDKYIY